MTALATDRIKAALESFLRVVFARVDYYGLYPARVTSQDASSLALDVIPDHPRWRDAAGNAVSVTAVPLRAFAPGVAVKLTAGARVLLGFEEGDPAKPFALPLWQTGTLTALEIPAGAANGAARVGDPVDRNAAMTTWMNAVGANFATLGTPLTPLVGSTTGGVSAGSSLVKLG